MPTHEENDYEASLLSRFRVARTFAAGDLGEAQYASAANALDISIRTLKRDIARAKRHVDFGEWRPKKRGPKPGSHHASPAVLSVYEEHVYGEASKKLNVAKLARDTQHALRNLGISEVDIPSDTTGERIVREIIENDPAHFANARHGRTGRRAFSLQKGSLEAQRPLEIVCIDHTLLDQRTYLIEGSNAVIRPCFTAAIDVFTSVCLAAFVSPVPPNATTVALCMALMSVPKTPLLRLYGIPGDWEAGGFGETLYVDGAGELVGDAVKSGCKRFLMNHWVGLPGRPERRARMERFWKTINSEVHSWEGTTLSNTVELEGHGGQRDPAWDFEEVQRRILIAVMEYNNETYGQPKLPPIMQWREHVGSAHVQRLIPQDPKRTFIAFLPYEDRRITFEGITFARCHYRSGDLEKLRYEGVGRGRFHYDPRDMSRIWIAYKDDFLEIPRVYPRFAPKDIHLLRRWNQDKAEIARVKRDSALLAKLAVEKKREWRLPLNEDHEFPEIEFSPEILKRMQVRPEPRPDEAAELARIEAALRLNAPAPPSPTDASGISTKEGEKLPPNFDIPYFNQRVK